MLKSQYRCDVMTKDIFLMTGDQMAAVSCCITIMSVQHSPGVWSHAWDISDWHESFPMLGQHQCSGCGPWTWVRSRYTFCHQTCFYTTNKRMFIFQDRPFDLFLNYYFMNIMCWMFIKLFRIRVEFEYKLIKLSCQILYQKVISSCVYVQIPVK